MKDVLIIEPFHGGSHAQLVNLLCGDDMIGSRVQLYTLSAKKWHWRARTSALYFSQIIEPSMDYRVLFCSSVLNLAELVSLRPDLAKLVKIVFFHENQLVYPVRKQQDRDFYYGYAQILTSMVADEVIFNSKYNRESFLDSIAGHLKLIPDHRPKQIAEKMRSKCRVMYFPLTFTKSHYIQASPSTLEAKKLKIDNQCHEHLEGQPFINQSFEKNPEDDSLQFNEKMEISSSDKSPHSPSVKSDHNLSDSFHKITNTESTEKTVKPECDSLNANNFAFKRSEDVCINSPDLDNIEKEKCGISFGVVYASTDSEESEKKHGDAFNDFEHKKDTKKCSHLHRTIEPSRSCPLHIVWPHRWEHDKGPQSFFDALFQLQENDLNFIVSVIGENFSQIPDIFETAQLKLKQNIHAWGYQTREDYLNILKSAHVVVSTADHEFFGVSMLEATHHGCYPLCPKRLVYPEIYPDECLYSTQAQLVKRLKQFCRWPEKIKDPKKKINMMQFSWEHLKEDYTQLLLRS